MELIYLPVAFACILYTWHNTDAFVEYLKLLGCKKLFYIEDFEKQRDNSLSLDYNTYLIINHPNFFVKLLTCPICLSTWFNIAALFIHKSFPLFFLLLWLTWVLYFLLKLIIIKADGN